MVGRNFDESCPVGATLKVLGGKWKVIILHSLIKNNTMRFNELRNLVPNITHATLTNQLRELEQDKIIKRQVYAEVPPKVEYTLTKIGETLRPILSNLKKWGSEYITKRKTLDCYSTQKARKASKSN